ncbi:HIT domain-containing protein [Candidatus Dependentiae bacterium]|jgi:histidine triad (HIT) family protein|nr:HIT domain-containing protein [Candidatus Dependentiae bacterium]
MFKRCVHVFVIGFIFIGLVAAVAPTEKPSSSFEQMAHANCAFCQIITRQSPAVIIDETDDLIVIEKRPIRKPVDCLIIPKKHIVNIKTLDASNLYDQTVLSKMALKAQELSKRLNGQGDFTITMNNGPQSAQTVFHMHMHFRSPNNWK